VSGLRIASGCPHVEEKALYSCLYAPSGSMKLTRSPEFPFVSSSMKLFALGYYLRCQRRPICQENSY